MVGQRWTPLILRDLFAGMTRFEDIRRDLGIASNILAARLDELERHGVVERRRYQSAPPRYEYLLTDKGRDLYPVIATLLAWGDKWLADADGPPALTRPHRMRSRHNGQDGVRTLRMANSTPATATAAPRPRRPAGPGHRLSSASSSWVGHAQRRQAQASSPGCPP